MTTKPDTIKISTQEKGEISAARADLHVTVKGSSIVSGSEAMKKAREVNQLVEALTSFGVGNEAIFLQGVHLETASGALMKSSSAIYRLKIQCNDLNQFAGMLEVISSQKNAMVDRVEWKYDENEARWRLLNAALENSKRKAEAVAAALGVKILGVYDFIETPLDEEPPYRLQSQGLAVRSAPAEQTGLGMDIQHAKTIQVRLDVWYRVSAF